MDDLIRKQDAIDALGEEPLIWSDDDDYSLGQFNQWENDVKALDALPSVQQERKTGYLFLLDNCSNFGYYCSACQKKLVKEGWSNTVKKIKFCPNCGVELIEECEDE